MGHHAVRYFRATVTAYEEARGALNAAWGLPQAGTLSALPPATECLRDNSGNVFFCADDWMCALAPAPAYLAAAIASGDAEELTESAVLEASARWQTMP